MAEAFWQQSALAHLNLLARAGESVEDAGILLCERPFRRQITLRGESDDGAFLRAAAIALGFDLPVAPNTMATAGTQTALWLGPSEWLVVGPESSADTVAQLRQRLAGVRHAVTDVSDSRTILGIQGVHARDVLAKASSLDLHPRRFQPGQCAQSTWAHTSMLLHQLSNDPARGPAYDIYIHRSVAEYAWRWLERSALEFGVAVYPG